MSSSLAIISSGPSEPPLTQREMAISQLLTEGATSAAIAHDLGIGEAMVYVQLKNLCLKIGAENRMQAAMWLLSHELKENA